MAVVQPTGRYMDCTAILAEVQANNERVKQLAADKGLKTTQNVAAGVAGTFIPVLWFGMDFQGTAETEITALQSRQQYLSMMADQKRCAAEPEPLPPPARAKRAAKPRAAAAAPQTEELSADAAAKHRREEANRRDSCAIAAGLNQSVKSKTKPAVAITTPFKTPG